MLTSITSFVNISSENRDTNEKDEQYQLRKMFIDFIKNKQRPEIVFSTGRGSKEYFLELDDQSLLVHIASTFVQTFLSIAKDSGGSEVTLRIDERTFEEVKELLIDSFEDKNVGNIVSITKKSTGKGKDKTLNIEVFNKNLRKMANIFNQLLILLTKLGLATKINEEIYLFSADLMKDQFYKSFINELNLKCFSKLIFTDKTSSFTLDFSDEDIEKMSRMFSNKILFSVEYPKEIEDFMNSVFRALC